MATDRPGDDPRAARPGGRRGLHLGIVVATLCALLAFGANLADSLDSGWHSVAPFLIALPLALLPVPLLVSLVLLLDRLEPEPPGNLAFAFTWGAGVAALLAGLINTAGLVFITQPALGRGAGEYFSTTFVAPVVEESLKGLVLLWLLWRRRPELDGPTDGIIYAAMVGLGFSMTENVGYYIGALVRPVAGGAALLGVTFVIRGLLAPFAHPAFTAMTGIGVAYAAARRRGRWAVAAGLLAAMVLHGTWNALTALGPGGLVIAYGMVACVLVVLVAVIIADRRRMVALIWQSLPTYGAGLAGRADLRMLSTLHGRRQARRWARGAGGRRAAAEMTGYQRSATELALTHQRAQRELAGQGELGGQAQALAGLMTAARESLCRRLPAGQSPPWARGADTVFRPPAAPAKAGPGQAGGTPAA